MEKNISINKSEDAHFTEREINIIKLICRQLTTKEIAVALNLHTRSIEDHRHKIQEKMGVKNMVGIALYALKHEIVKMSEL